MGDKESGRNAETGGETTATKAIASCPGTLAQVLGERASSIGDKTAIICETRSLSYGQLAAEAQRIGRHLIDRGFDPGARVAILARNADWFYQILGGAAVARLCLLSLNHRLSPAEIRWIIEDAKPRIIFVGKELEELAQAALTGYAERPEMVVVDNGLVPLAPAPQRLDDAPATVRDALPEDDLLLLYTSGTTGRPKGVRLANHNLASVWRTSEKIAGFDYSSGDVVLTVMPQFHIAGLNSGLIALFHGATIVIASEFKVENIVELIEARGCTQAFFVPSMIIMLLEHGPLDELRYASLRQIAYGGSAIHGALLERARACLRCGFAQLYGMTETTGAGTVLSPRDHDAPGKAGSCGRAWHGLTIHVLDNELRPLPPGERGQLAIEGDIVMQGYWNNPAATEEACCEYGLLTGDGGFIDDDGFVFIQDRIKDMIISGGENISPTEVEDAIAGCPGVRDVAVVGIPSDRWGEEVKAFVVRDGSAPATALEILDWARQRLASFKLPKSIAYIDVVPRNASGKILRRQLRESQT